MLSRIIRKSTLKISLHHLYYNLNLGENASAPTNMMDWAAKQRALKAAERQSKNESAEYLRSYKPTSVEQNALKTMKEEDREKSRLAQEQLHSYRAKFIGRSGGKGTSSSQKVISTVGLNNEEVKSDFSMAEAVDELNNSRNPDGNPITPTKITESLVPTDKAKDEESPSPSQLSSEGIVLVESPEKAISEPEMIYHDENPEKLSTSDDWIDVSSVAQSSGEEEKCTEPTPVVKEEIGPEISDSVEIVTDVINVEFTFCLLTLSEQPDISKYLRAAESIIGNPATGPAETKSVQSVTNYSDRPGVHHHTITASICVSNQDDDNRIVKQRALGLLKEAVRNGSFKLKAIEMFS